jgi:hypothetical protein
MSGPSPISGPSATGGIAATDNSPKLTGAALDAKWNELLGPIQKSNEKTLGPTKSKQYNERMAKDLAEFKASHPNGASEAEIQEFFKKQNSKHSGYLRVTKFMEDSFMKKLQQKAKEQQADRWS